MLYIIGLGLNARGISLEALEVLKKCSKAYLEGYTVDFPYASADLQKVIGKNVEILKRDKVESDFLVKEAKKAEVALLVYGSPLFATTHLALLEDAKKTGVEVKIFYSASVFDALASCGLQLYKFGKITSMPAWQKNFTPDSFMDVVKQNQSVNAHSLILCDIGLEFKKALEQLEEAAKNKKLRLDKIVVCSRLGTADSRICYDSLENLKKLKSIKMPYCLIIPSELHFTEKEALENL